MPTIGVSIALPDECGTHLQDYRLSLGDELARQIPSHITLAPPTEIAADQIDELHAHLQAVATGQSPFEVHLRGTGTFRPTSPVVFISVVAGISGCERLAKSVRDGMLDSESSYPYHPHVTIAHHLDEATMDRAFTEMTGYECAFEVKSFWLYTFEEATGWVKSAEFMLG